MLELRARVSAKPICLFVCLLFEEGGIYNLSQNTNFQVSKETDTKRGAASTVLLSDSKTVHVTTHVC